MVKYRIREWIKKHNILDKLLRIAILPFLKIMQFCERIYHLNNIELKKYRNKFLGEKCFIIATGSSLELKDLDEIKKRHIICFGVNSIVTAYESTQWRPDFYVIQDYHAFERFRNYIELMNEEKIFIGSPVYNYYKVKIPVIRYELNILNHHYYNIIGTKPQFRYSSDASKSVYNGFSVVYSAMQLATYMGFKEIYLLGVDCNYVPGNAYFNDASNKGDNGNHVDTGLMIQAFLEAENFCSSHGIKIYNATRGGMLEAFERKNFDMLMDNWED